MVMPYRIAYGSDIAPCIRIDKPLMVYVIDGHNNISYIQYSHSQKRQREAFIIELTVYWEPYDHYFC